MKIALVIFITLPWRAVRCYHSIWSDPRAVARAADRLAGRTRALLCIDGVPTAALAAGTVCRCSPRRGGRADTGDCAQTLWHHRIFSALNHAASLASVGALLLMPSLPVMVLPLLAFAAAMAGLILLKMLAKTHQPMKLALTGVALSACWASLTDYLMLSRPQDVNNALLWLTAAYGAVTGAL
ncbi:iron-dicitrate transporter subunit FecD [Escherichia coli]|uniref:Iron-dicitrate transporter subunit FecD n=1 Tax=Escherichia coli TaxID=562 RepID=A0A2X1PFA0_ECOLX|nr:iron-dicitrate transporter subunit FecD [Escherichia coli]